MTEDIASGVTISTNRSPISVFKSRVDKTEIVSIDTKLTDIRNQLTNLVRLNVKAGIDSDVYNNEYARLTKEMDLLRDKREA